MHAHMHAPPVHVRGIDEEEGSEGDGIGVASGPAGRRSLDQYFA